MGFCGESTPVLTPGMYVPGDVKEAHVGLRDNTVLLLKFRKSSKIYRCSLLMNFGLSLLSNEENMVLLTICTAYLSSFLPQLSEQGFLSLGQTAGYGNTILASTLPYYHTLA